MDDLIAEQALVDALVADFTEDDWNRMASYCTTWTFKDVICHIALFDYCAVELLAGRGESVNAVADAASGAGRALPRHGVSRPKRRRHPELVARAARP